MGQSAKFFADILNRCLDEMDAPASTRERAAILSKILDIPKQQAWSLIEGQQVPDKDLIQKIVMEFELDPKQFPGDK